MKISCSLTKHPAVTFCRPAGERACRIRRVPCRALQQAITSNVQSFVEECSTSTSTSSRDRRLLQSRDAVAQNRHQSVPRGRQWAVDSPAVYVALDKALLFGPNAETAIETLRSGLIELKAIGVTGIVVDVWWSSVENSKPEVYDWSSYRQLLRLICDAGLKVKVDFNFHSSRQAGIQLPLWVQEVAQRNPDVLFRDREGNRSQECLSLGVDDVQVLAGRSAMQVYHDLMASFRDEFSFLVEDGIIVSYTVGAGPDGELRYPAHPNVESRWAFRGAGEFQCYDRYMMSSLMACAQRVGQPSWGLAGPHDAGDYSVSPHQCQFFNHRFGSWETQYGRFFLQWYASKLVQHAERLVKVGPTVFGDIEAGGSVPRLDIRVPAVHWWYGSASHAAELSAGYYNAGSRDGYLPVFNVLAKRGAGVVLTGAEARASEQLAGVLSRPEALLTQQRVVASALHLPVGLRNGAVRFDDAALQRMEAALMDGGSSQGINILPAETLTLSCLCPAMFESGTWQRVKAFVTRIRHDEEGPDAALASGSRQLMQGQAYGPIAMA